MAMGRPQITMRGPGASWRRTPSRREKATRPFAPFSRSVVTPGVQESARVPGGLQEKDVVVLFRDVVAEGAVARGDEVRVGVDEPGQDGGGAVVPPLHRGAVGSLDLALAADRGDAITVDQQRGMVDGRGHAAVEQTVGRDQGEARRRRRYRSLTSWS